MVSILHRNRLHIEIMTFGKRSYAVRIVIRHQKITLKSIRDSEERLMIKLIVSVKPFARLLARCGVRRVNEENSIRSRSVFSQIIDPVSMDETDLFVHLADFNDAPR